jgi:hypothetical protein
MITRSAFKSSESNGKSLCDGELNGLHKQFQRPGLLEAICASVPPADNGVFACRVRAVEFFAAERVASLVNLMLVARLRVLLVGARNLDVSLSFLIAVSVARR